MTLEEAQEQLLETQEKLKQLENQNNELDTKNKELVTQNEKLVEHNNKLFSRLTTSNGTDHEEVEKSDEEIENDLIKEIREKMQKFN